MRLHAPRAVYFQACHLATKRTQNLVRMGTGQVFLGDGFAGSRLPVIGFAATPAPAKPLFARSHVADGHGGAAAVNRLCSNRPKFSTLL